jgi:hypothetical protein
MLQAGRSRFLIRMSSLQFFSMYLIRTRDTPLSTKVDTKFRRQVAVAQSVVRSRSVKTLTGPGVGSASMRNEYKICSLGEERDQSARLTSLLTASRLSRQCGNLNISQP